ncbi:MAG: chorismate mutase [Clostridia bacterium]|nr:chorismate mutase [Clostridia bacterium]
MTELDKARARIGEVDREMARLFERRMDAVRDVAAYKKEQGLPITDKTREEALLENNTAYISNEEYKQYYVNFLRETFEVSKNFQLRLLDGMRVAYSGVEGAFANIVAKRIFPSAAAVPYGSFDDAYKAVETGECDCAVLPVENSTNGDVGGVLDLAFFGSLYINGMYEAEIVHHLLAAPGASIDGIKTVMSHPQALGQCAEYIRRHGWTTLESVNTAVAAKTVAESGRADLAAIASEEAGAIFGLSRLDSHINQGSVNTTRFAVFSRVRREPSPNDGNFVMLFTVKNTAGALGKAINVIGDHGFNLRAIKSRPRKELIWEYYFYAEGEGNIASDNGTDMLEELSECCNDVKILGSYEKELKV